MTNEVDAVARQSAAAMLSADRASASLGIELLSVRAGSAEVRMAVHDAMLNGLDVCHGGLIFTLADTAMAVAGNSYDERSVAAAASIDLLRPVHAGDVLTATAREVHRRGRTGIYDVAVVSSDGELVATFRGRTHTVGGSITSPST